MTTHNITLCEQDVLNQNGEISTNVEAGDVICYALDSVAARLFSFHQDATNYVNQITSTDPNAASYITNVEPDNQFKSLEFTVSASAPACQITFNLQVQNLATNADWEIDPLIVIGRPPTR